MTRRLWPWLTVLLLFPVVHMALAATSTVVLTVEGMT
jgi:hypothetical protein